MRWLIVLAMCCGCVGDRASQRWMEDNGHLKVLCTTAMVADLTRRVGGEQIDCYTLIQGDSDPHSYQLVKGDDELFARAACVIYNGLGLEHSPSLAYQLAHHPRAYGLGEYLLEHVPEDILFVDGACDPHIWMNVGLFAKSVPAIVNALSRELPEWADEFALRGAAVMDELDSLHEALYAQLQAIPESRRYLVTTHDAFRYFTCAYLALPGESWWPRCQAPEGLAPESQLSTADIQRMVDHIVRYHIHVIFAESNVSKASIRKVIDACRGHGVEVRLAAEPLYADSMGSESYEGMMRYDANTIAKELTQ